MIIKKLRERDGIEIDTVDEALENYIKAVTQIFFVFLLTLCAVLNTTKLAE